MAIVLGMRQLLILPLLLVPLTACKKNEQLHLPPPEAMGPNMSGKTPHQMANCPSAVPGAVTRIDRTIDGIDVTVTALGQDAQSRIIALAGFHERAPSDPAVFGPMQHTGMRTGYARTGYCPIMHRGVTLTTTAIPGGVRMHMRADSPFRVKELQDIVSSRAARMPGFASS